MPYGGNMMNSRHMTRVQRNRMRKRRKRRIVFSLLFCIGIFITGVLIINQAMMRTLALSEEENILSFQGMGEGLEDVASSLPVEEWMAAVKEYWFRICEYVKQIIKFQ